MEIYYAVILWILWIYYVQGERSQQRDPVEGSLLVEIQKQSVRC